MSNAVVNSVGTKREFFFFFFFFKPTEKVSVLLNNFPHTEFMSGTVMIPVWVLPEQLT